MEITDILEYTKSSHFYSTDEENIFHIPDYGHIFRKAHNFCGLKGVYTLQTDFSKSNPIVPVVYVCKAKDEQEAGEIHKHVFSRLFQLTMEPFGEIGVIRFILKNVLMLSS